MLTASTSPFPTPSDSPAPRCRLNYVTEVLSETRASNSTSLRRPPNRIWQGVAPTLQVWSVLCTYQQVLVRVKMFSKSDAQENPSWHFGQCCTVNWMLSEKLVGVRNWVEMGTTLMVYV